MYAMIAALLASVAQLYATPFGLVRHAPQSMINMRSPLSGSVLVAQALHAGRVRLPFYNNRPSLGELLTCTPTPCTVPNVQASEGGQPVNETPLAANPVNRRQMLSGGNDYNCPTTQGFFASHDGGSTWNHTCLGNVAGGFGVGDPIVGYNTTGMSFIGGIDEVSGTVANIVFEHSSNGGTTWSSAALGIVGITPYTFVDKPWLQIDDGATSPRKDEMYVSTTEFDPNSNSAMVVSHSTNNGATWTSVMVDAVVYPLVDQFTDLAVGSDGAVYLSWMRCSATGPSQDCGGTTSAIMFSKSTDGGVTWTVPIMIASAKLVPDNCGAFYGCLPNTPERVSNVPPIDVDRSGGQFNNHLYVAYYNFTGAQMQVKVVTSADGGATWSSPVRVTHAANDEFFPWLTTNDKGFVGVSWLDRRLDPSNINYDAFATVSKNGGARFALGVRLSSVSSDPFNDGFGGGFMGDYTGGIWVKNTVYASYTDTRNGVDGQDEIGGYRI
ncbi:MAG TPA: sialidase family protein [Candidatus Eremiobacteraceae bacterium]|nr:sialidase family protein [Candidatus Eremiobacteraceae bacterium]